ncbi:transcriptional regulator [Atlantibacter hermannii]|nr:transcriptional regulator [Atlantibacter hermannii]
MRKPAAPLFQDLLLESGIIKDQVYHALRNAILDGRLAAGSKIPSTRALAEMMGIARNSVIAGFERLMDEGYLHTRHGAGTFVARHVPDPLLNAPHVRVTPEKRSRRGRAGESRYRRGGALWRESLNGGGMNRVFAVGVGCTDLFPHDLWGRLLGRVWRQSRRELGLHTGSSGYQPLRQAIARYIQATRGRQLRRRLRHHRKRDPAGNESDRQGLIDQRR